MAQIQGRAWMDINPGARQPGSSRAEEGSGGIECECGRCFARHRTRPIRKCGTRFFVPGCHELCPLPVAPRFCYGSPPAEFEDSTPRWSRQHTFTVVFAIVVVVIRALVIYKVFID